jgi:hypothetical protein
MYGEIHVHLAAPLYSLHSALIPHGELSHGLDLAGVDFGISEQPTNESP